ncbi:sensor histidine kinase [Sphingomonas sp. Leaf4]|uniref:sensor histidine kinase n=1 Tax=Sphingomonas sp. Leaf4 TaxID=2876553 RepID=UPI001E491FDF|nr:PAS domain-containing sensor histidine kinase [Sphingomonas sp. Leaf4]
MARTFSGETVTFEEMPLTMTRNGFDEETWWDFSYSPLHDEQGAVAGLLNVTLEVSGRVIARRERDNALRELRESEAFNRSVLTASTDCIKVVELTGELSFMTEGGMRVMDISDFNDVRGCPWPDFFKEDGPDLAREALEAARQGRSSHFLTQADTFVGTLKSWSVSVSPIVDSDGRTSRILSVSRDVTELAQAREQLQLLNGELAHRIKNTMSVVQAIANQTIGKVADGDAMRVFGERLSALASSHDLLTAHSWSTATLDELARRALATFGQDRFDLSGPRVELGPRAALALSLMLHELATNAVKYGALSVPDGAVTVEWMLRQAGTEDVLHLSWRERGGPPAIEPTRKGFGSRLIGMGLTGSGGVKLDYGTSGLVVEASAPLHQLQQA